MASVAQIPPTPQQLQLAAVQAAQAQAYHNDLDPNKVNQHAIQMQQPNNSIAYEETEDPPTRAMAYFHLMSHQFAIYMTFVLGALVIAFSIVYDDTKALRDDVGNHIRWECNDINRAIFSYFVLVVITGSFAVLTWAAYFVKKWFRYLPVVCAILFLISAFALAVYNVAGTVYFGKPNSTACWQRGEVDATEAYYMVEGAVITIWVTMGLPTALLLGYTFWNQVKDLAVEFPSDRKLKEIERAERELLMVPSNPSRAFRYP